jgi:hypothetical protein
MERIGAEVGGIREVTGWRHFSIADRVAFVRQYLTDADVRRRYRRSIALLRGTLIVVIAGFFLAAAWSAVGELRRLPDRVRQAADPQTVMLSMLGGGLESNDPTARGVMLFTAAEAALAGGRDEDAARWMREAVALGRRDAPILGQYAERLEKAGRPVGARLVWKALSERQDLSPDDRETARKKAAALEGR